MVLSMSAGVSALSSDAAAGRGKSVYRRQASRSVDTTTTATTREGPLGYRGIISRWLGWWWDGIIDRESPAERGRILRVVIDSVLEEEATQQSTALHCTPSNPEHTQVLRVRMGEGIRRRFRHCLTKRNTSGACTEFAPNKDEGRESKRNDTRDKHLGRKAVGWEFVEVSGRALTRKVHSRYQFRRGASEHLVQCFCWSREGACRGPGRVGCD